MFENKVGLLLDLHKRGHHDHHKAAQRHTNKESPKYNVVWIYFFGHSVGIILK